MWCCGNGKSKKIPEPPKENPNKVTTPSLGDHNQMTGSNSNVNQQHQQQQSQQAPPQPIVINNLKKLLDQPVEVFLNNQFSDSNRFYQLLPEHQKIMKKNDIKTLQQLAGNLKERTKIFNDIQDQQFTLEYDYLPRQQPEPLKGSMPCDNDYTYVLNYQDNQILQDCKKVLVMGVKNSGKSYFINALANSFLIGYADKFRYRIAEYDVNDKIQDCNLMEPNAQYQFFEVPDYQNQQNDNQETMNNIYVYLRDKKITIDMVLMCRRYSNSELTQREKQIIFNLVEIFGKDFIKKFQIINTAFDFGQQHTQNLVQGLQEISNIYEYIPDPKMMFVNSAIEPKKGEQGNIRFKSVEEARDNIVKIMNENQKQLIIREEFVYNHRRELQANINRTIEEIKNQLLGLKPYLINYFSISQVNENDSMFMAEVIQWATFDPITFHEQYSLEDILQNVMLSDVVIDAIRQQAEEAINRDLPPDQQIRKKNELREQLSNKQKLIQVREQYTREKKLRIDGLMKLAIYWRDQRAEFLEGTFQQADISIETFMTRLMPDSLRIYLQQDQQFEDNRLRDEFQELRSRLFLPTEALLATQILQGMY